MYYATICFAMPECGSDVLTPLSDSSLLRAQAPTAFLAAFLIDPRGGLEEKGAYKGRLVGRELNVEVFFSFPPFLLDGHVVRTILEMVNFYRDMWMLRDKNGRQKMSARMFPRIKQKREQPTFHSASLPKMAMPHSPGLLFIAPGLQAT